MRKSIFRTNHTYHNCLLESSHLENESVLLLWRWAIRMANACEKTTCEIPSIGAIPRLYPIHSNPPPQTGHKKPHLEWSLPRTISKETRTITSFRREGTREDQSTGGAPLEFPVRTTMHGKSRASSALKHDSL